jgi:HK97 family phage major capsid protein
MLRACLTMKQREQMVRAGIDSGTSTTGQPFKFTQPGEFIPILRNKTSVMRAGSTVLSGLTGPVTFPKQTSAAGVTWSAENPGSDNAVTNLLTTTVTLSFKSIMAGTAFSRQMLFSAASGNYDMEAIIQSDIAAVIGVGIDLAGLNGLGSSNQPKGVLKNTSIGSVALGTNGGTMSWGSWVDLETKIGQANATTSRMAYITNSAQRGTAKKSAVLGNTASGVPIWTGASGDDFDGQANGYRAIASEQVPGNLTKGTSTTVCSAIVFGAWEHNLIGMFGPGFETIVDPYSKKYQGMIEVAAWSYVDVAQRYDGAFAAVLDAL